MVCYGAFMLRPTVDRRYVLTPNRRTHILPVTKSHLHCREHSRPASCSGFPDLKWTWWWRVCSCSSAWTTGPRRSPQPGVRTSCGRQSCKLEREKSVWLTVTAQWYGHHLSIWIQLVRFRSRAIMLLLQNSIIKSCTIYALGYCKINHSGLPVML